MATKPVEDRQIPHEGGSEGAEERCSTLRMNNAGGAEDGPRLFSRPGVCDEIKRRWRSPLFGASCLAQLQAARQNSRAIRGAANGTKSDLTSPRPVPCIHAVFWEGSLLHNLSLSSLGNNCFGRSTLFKYVISFSDF